MDNLTSIRLELNISAQKMVQQIQVHNKHIEAEISKGIQMAMEEILGDENFSLKIKDQTIMAIEDIVLKAALSWSVKEKITKIIEEKIAEKVNDYAEKIAAKVTSNLQ